MRRTLHLCTLFAALLILPAAAGAQNVPLVRFLPGLVSTAARVDSIASEEDRHGHFVKAADQCKVTAALNDAIAVQLGTFTAGVPWSGRSFTIDPSTGNAVPKGGFGSSFAERAVTAGRGRFNMGLAQEATSYSSIDGIDLRGATINYFREHDDCCTGTTELERDLLTETLSIDLHRNVFSLYGNYGVTDKLDIGVALPVVTVRMSGRVTSRILRTATEADQGLHAMDIVELAHRTHYDRGSSAGLGDVMVRAKYHLAGRQHGGLAAAVNLRLPTGNADELLGSGVLRTTATLIWSEEMGRVSPHVNASYTHSNKRAVSGIAASALPAEMPSEIGGIAGVEISLHPRATLVLDAVGRRLGNMPRFERYDTRFTSKGPGPLPSADYVATDDVRLLDSRSAVSTLMGVAGTKFHLIDNFVLSGDVVFPVAGTALRANRSVMIGLNYGF
jgi:hypothetical protein